MGLEGIQNYMIGIILFIIVISGGVYIIGTFKDSNTSLDTVGEINSFNQSLNKAANITSSVNKLDQQIQSVNSQDVGILGWLNALVGSVYNGLAAIGGTLSFMTIVASETSAIFGIPSFIFPLILLIITVIIGFAIWSAITRT